MKKRGRPRKYTSAEVKATQDVAAKRIRRQRQRPVNGKEVRFIPYHPQTVEPIQAPASQRPDLSGRRLEVLADAAAFLQQDGSGDHHCLSQSSAEVTGTLEEAYPSLAEAGSLHGKVSSPRPGEAWLSQECRAISWSRTPETLENGTRISMESAFFENHSPASKVGDGEMNSSRQSVPATHPSAAAIWDVHETHTTVHGSDNLARKDYDGRLDAVSGTIDVDSNSREISIGREQDKSDAYSTRPHVTQLLTLNHSIPTRTWRKRQIVNGSETLSPVTMQRKHF